MTGIPPKPQRPQSAKVFGKNATVTVSHEMSHANSFVPQVQTFKVTDTRKIATALPASPATAKGRWRALKKGGGLRRRLELQVSRNRRLRTDLDMSVQQEELRTRKENTHLNWISKNKPTAPQRMDEIAMMKMLVIEAECFQEARGFTSLKKEVTAAKDIKRDSSVLIRGLPLEILPDGPLFAKRAILALPLWHQEVASRKQRVC